MCCIFVKLCICFWSPVLPLLVRLSCYCTKLRKSSCVYCRRTSLLRIQTTIFILLTENKLAVFVGTFFKYLPFVVTLTSVSNLPYNPVERNMFSSETWAGESDWVNIHSVKISNFYLLWFGRYCPVMDRHALIGSLVPRYYIQNRKNRNHFIK